MTYAGLTIADKTALEDAKARGAEWVARDGDGTLCGYERKPSKLIAVWGVNGEFCVLTEADLVFVSYLDTEPVNIDLALAQIAEMEKAQKPDDCEYCSKLSKYAGWGYAEWFEQRAVDEVYEISVAVKFCPNCGKPINSSYTEGETE